MAEQDGVNARHLGQPRDRVLGEPDGLAALEARVRDGDDQLRALGLHARHEFVGRFEHVSDADFAFQVLLVPLHDLRRHEADHADLEAVLGASFVAQLTLQDHIGCEGILRIGGGHAGLIKVDIGIDVGKLRAGDGLAQEGQAVVELVVADVGGVHTELVQHLVGRVHLARSQRLDTCHIVAQRAALQQVTVVEVQAVLRLGPRCLDQRHRLGQAVVLGHLVLVVVVVQQVHVHIRGLQDAQLDFCRSRR